MEPIGGFPTDLYLDVMQPWTLKFDLPILRLAALVFSVWALLSGCTAPTFTYSRGGADAADFRRDSYACVEEPQMSVGASGTPMSVGAGTDGKREKLYRMCMEANGWTAEAPR
jgi:hypothetical protein